MKIFDLFHFKVLVVKIFDFFCFKVLAGKPQRVCKKPGTFTSCGGLHVLAAQQLLMPLSARA